MSYLIHISHQGLHVLGKTLGTDKGVVERINREVSNNRVDVKWKMPDGSNYNQVINKRDLRYPTPQFESKLERDFRNG